mmetsp:Transcript_12655/g.25486  ORF Transcript_12655/g.25486 Transcript_12655/m.25486 type:complete len:222 (-) Transcript_12655:1498-2163(-)
MRLGGIELPLLLAIDDTQVTREHLDPLLVSTLGHQIIRIQVRLEATHHHVLARHLAAVRLVVARLLRTAGCGCGCGWGCGCGCGSCGGVIGTADGGDGCGGGGGGGAGLKVGHVMSRGTMATPRPVARKANVDGGSDRSSSSASAASSPSDRTSPFVSSPSPLAWSPWSPLSSLLPPASLAASSAHALRLEGSVWWPEVRRKRKSCPSVEIKVARRTCWTS